MKKSASILAYWAMLISFAFAADDQGGFKVKYLSADHVYINVGSADGLSAGDTLSVTREGRLIGKIEVVFVSTHSSSCSQISPAAEIKSGDRIEYKAVKPEPQVPKSEKSVAEVDTSLLETSYSGVVEEQDDEGNSRLTGSISFSYFRWDDRSESDLDFAQPGGRTNLTVDRLWGSSLALRFRTRSRYNIRSKQYSAFVEENRFRNNIYEFSLGKGDYDETGFRLGRIIPRRLSGVGYLDGLFTQVRVSSTFRFGAFGGTMPQWQYTSPQTSIQKYGLFVTFVKGKPRGFNIETTLAMTAEYHLSTVSREFIHLRNSLGSGSTLRFFQSADIDINRGWRGTKSSETLTLTNLYVSGRYRISRTVGVGLSLDNRKRYWTYEQRTIADSLFDDLARRGLKASLDLNLPWNFRLNSNVGLRARQGDSRTTKSYSFGARKANLFNTRISLDFNTTAFSNEYADGFNISYGAGKYFRRGDYISFNYGIYSYDYNSSNIRRSSRTIQFRGNFLLFDPAFLSWEFGRSYGTDIDGNTYLLEMGYRIR